ncbi:MAG: thiamine phosphate synthase [Methylococcales bacterium]
MKLPFPNSGLYAITSTHQNATDKFVSAVDAAIKGGTRVVQYRDKSKNPCITKARQILETCHASAVPLIINDDIALVKAIGADGVHLGKDDADIHQARVLLGNDAIIGVSCYNSIGLAEKAQREGVTYVAYGRFFPSRSKPNAPSAGLDVLTESTLDIPIVAIGGVTAQNGKHLLDAGADLLAVIDGIFGQEDIQQAAEQLSRLF